MAASYANFFIASSRIVFPLLDQRHDDEAAEVLARLLPRPRGRRGSGREILLGGGNIHCITQQVPGPGQPG